MQKKSVNPKVKKNPTLYSWMNPNLEVRDTNTHGMGVYANAPINKDDVLAIFGGHVMTIAEESLLPERIRDLAHQISDNFVIGINDINDLGPSDFFNHSCQPNAGFDGQIFLVAMNQISANEEITFDYAMTIGGSEAYTLECSCGSKICRGTITNSDWKNSELQKKYAGYFQWYLAKLISRQ